MRRLFPLDELALAYSGLLHDIGKVIQRSQNIRKKHSEYSEEFVKSILPEWLDGKNEVARLVGTHHEKQQSHRDLKDSWWALIHADHISAIERELESREDEKPFYKSHYRLLLIPYSSESDEYHRFYRVAPLEPGNLSSAEPVEVSETTSNVYRSLVDNLYAEIRDYLNSFYQKGCDFAYFVSLSELLRKYLTFVPSAPSVERVVTNSLYEHSRITAALATCFKRQGDDKLTLILGDVGRIQAFVYGQKVAKGTLKSLRGRSLYVSFLADAIAKHVLSLLKLPPVNLIYSSGGHFMIISQLLDEDQKARIREHVNSFLLKRHGGALNVYIAYKDFEAGSVDIGKIIESLFTEVLSREKARPLIDNLQNEYERIFEPSESREICESCGIREESAEGLKDFEDLKLCGNCHGLVQIAKPLAEAKYLIEVWCSKGELPTFEYWDEPINFTRAADNDGLKLCYYLAEDENRLKGIIDILLKSEESKLELIWVKTINDSNFCKVFKALNGIPHSSRERIAVGFCFMSRRTPSRNGDIYSLDELARESKGSKEIAYLKMDLDRIGELIREKSSTLSGLATITQSLSFIMESMIDPILDTQNNLTYLIYSGGDDLMLVGPWDDVVTCALVLNERLRRLFGSRRPTITAVIRTSDPKIPVRVMLDDLNADMQKAKIRRNCISFNGEIIEWEHFKEALSFSREWARDIESEAVSRSLLFEMAKIFGEYASSDEKYWKIHRNKLKYAIARALKTAKKRDTIKRLDDMEKKYLKEITLLFPVMRVVTALTEKYTRKEVRS